MTRLAKKPLPLLPDCIGVVTSASGAVIHDIVRVLDNRFPGYHLLLAHARVQGEGAAEEIVAALQRLQADGRAQVIICGRGGGSAEDLAAFNSEAVVRAIVAAQVPVVSAVGHEVDVTLADLAADFRAPTPSAAAERVLPERRLLLAGLLERRQRLLRGVLAILARQRSLVQLRQQRLLHPRRKLEFFRVRCDDLQQRLAVAGSHLLLRRRQRLEGLRDRLASWAGGAVMGLFRARLAHVEQRMRQAGWQHLLRNQERLQRADLHLRGLSPLAVLQRGYAIVYDQRGLVSRRADALQVGERVRVLLAQGELEAVIHHLKEN
ncbi:MAG: exodeoxyribonuclease VII large subunit [Magnetococcus sp. YQC-3]